ncbi:C-C chemokine receptor type 8-like [Danio aesculapii]|uniref:C-C chemokine receptor type 8-like n=1 Tax=Danio aesculapii TaxID=1142201 RepID=UPI0024C05CA5|nr:C-C chemokine receptor type 8-like [Danio aesculapii]
MHNSTVNITTPEASSNSTSIGIMQSLDIAMYLINFVFGLPIHSYIIWLIVTGTRSRVASEFFVLNLSLTEIVVSLNCLFFALTYWFSSFLILRIFFIGFSITARPLFQCLMCVERYLAVVHPVTFLKYKPLRYRAFCCVVTWIITLGSCLCCNFILTSFGIYAHAWFYMPQFILYLSIQLFCLVAVLRALKQSGPGERKREKEENHMKRKAFNIILLTTVNMVILYVPITVSALFNNLTQLNIQEVWLPALICYVLASFLQPVLYLHRNGKCLCFHPP